MSGEGDIPGFLADESWRGRFDDDTLAAGMRLRAKVRELRGGDEAHGVFVLRAEVNGEQAAVTCWPEDGGIGWESECTCEAGRFCAHAAALLAAASRPGNRERLLAGHAVRSRAAPALETAARLATPAADVPELRATPVFRLEIVREPTVSRIARLLLQAMKLPDTGDWVVARPYADYDGHRVPLTGGPRPDGTEVATANGPRRIHHDVPAEMSAVMSLQQAGLESLAGHAEFRFLLALAGKRDGDTAAEAGLWFPAPTHGSRPAEYWTWLRDTGAAQLAAGGWTVEFAPDVGHEIIDLDPDDFRYELQDDGRGWFHLSVGFEIGGRKLDLLPILADLLGRGALEASPEFPEHGHILHLLPDGAALRLPVARVRRILGHFAALIDPRRFKSGALKLHPLDAAAITTAIGAAIESPPALAELAGKLHDFHGIEPVPVPADLQAELRVYQLDGFRWMQFLARHGLHGILADDMGLGKTLQTLAHVLGEKSSGRNDGKPTLVVAPTSVVPNWRAEAARFAPGLRVLVLDGPRRASYFRSIPYADLVLTSYALLQRDIEKLRGFPFHLAVLDEAQNVKNPSAKVAQAACKLDAHHRLCLSGTPVENHLGELWSLMRFLMPGFLGSQEDFNRRFRNPVEKNDDQDCRVALQRRVAPLILRRTKDQVAKELPPKTELIHHVELNTAQKDLYETVRATMDKRVRQAIAARGLEGSRMVFLEALLKLRQICCEPRLLPFEGEARLEAEQAGSAKLDYLADLLDTLFEEGRRILLFSQFTSMLELIEELLRGKRVPYLKLTGESKNRGELVEKFQGGEAPLFLISLKAGGTGLNLTAADAVIHYDPWWNPAVEAQATDRAYRIGQTQPVFVHKLVCQGTVEERIHQLQAKKSSLADALLSDAARAAAPDETTLAALLAPMERE